jgi:hypothetical protein
MLVSDKLAPKVVFLLLIILLLVKTCPDPDGKHPNGA